MLVKNRFTDESIGEFKIKSGANLSRADLSRANLSGANLSRADLSRADLSRADLSRANLSRANLSIANLSGANLSEANLSRANLSRANLFNCTGNGKEIKSISLQPWNVVLLENIIWIGCKKFTVEEWRGMDNDNLSLLESGSVTLELITKYRNLVEALVAC